MTRLLAAACAAVFLTACGDTPDDGDTTAPDAGGTIVADGGDTIAVGDLGGACYPNDTCNHALVCADGFCVAGTSPDAGGGDVDAGGGDVDAGGGDVDAGGGDVDAGGGDVDAGGGDVDAGGGDVDAGGGDVDAGGGDVDAGGGGVDAGGGGVDAGSGPTPTNNVWIVPSPWETKVRDQAEITKVYVSRQAFVVVYSDVNGARGPALFSKRVSQLSNSRVLLELDPLHNTGAHWAPHQTLHLAVYDDVGTRSVYEPGVDPLLVDSNGEYMEKRLELRFISSTTDEASAYYYRNCTTEQYENNRTDLPVDCRCNEALTGGLPICWAPGEAYPKGHKWGTGPRLADVNNVGREVGGGFVDVARREFITAMNWKDGNTYTQSVGTIWAINIDTGDRRVVSGVIDTPNGYQVTGGGYNSNVTVGGVLRHTAPMPYLWDVQVGPDGQWYTYGSDTQDNVEIIRVNPVNGDRTLVWHVAVAGQNHAMGQCPTSRAGALSVQYNEKSFTMDGAGNFYLSFHDGKAGDGIVKIPANGATCTPIMRLNVAADALATYPQIGTGSTFQSQNIRGMGWVNGKIVFYTVLGNKLYSMDPATGNRTIISSPASPQVGTGSSAIGENWFVWDDATQLLWTSGGAADRFVAINMVNGDRQNLLQLSSSSPLVPGGYPVAHDTRGPLNPGTWSRERFSWHPDNPDHVLMIINGMALGVYEIHTSNSFTHSL